jgi:hypothetical protein
MASPPSPTKREPPARDRQGLKFVSTTKWDDDDVNFVQPHL